MADGPNNTRGDPAQVPNSDINEKQVDDAYAAHSALMRTAQLEPALLENEYFKALQDTAYARFLAVFRAL